jgi:hypothetical protein
MKSFLGIAFKPNVLHKFFESGSSVQNVVATYDIVVTTKQECLVSIDSKESIGVVIQGPIMKDFTLRMCEFYARTYPSVKFILSTWEGEDLSEFENFSAGNFEICKNLKPVFPGPSNINLQILSTQLGIQKLEEYGITHILKTRTDVLLGNPQFLNYLSWMKKKGNSNAIVFSSFNSFLFRLYSLTDQVMFGNFEDIKQYWSSELVKQGEEISFPEKYLFRKYLAHFDFDIVESFETYLAALENYAVIADHEQLGQIWNKGVFTSLSYRWRGANFPNSMSPLSTWLWESIKDNQGYIRDLYKQLS